MGKPLHRSHKETLACLTMAAGVLWQTQALLVAQTDEIPLSTDYLLHVWQRDDGLPHNTVSAIVQTRDGYLWIGTYEGLARFDGERFEHYRPADTPALASGHVDCLQADTHGILWIGLERGGLVRWDKGEFTPLAPLGAYTARIHALAPDGPQTVWAGLSQGRIQQWNAGAWQTFGRSRDVPVRGRVYCAMDTDGRMWFASENSLGYFAEGQWVPLVTNQPSFYQVVARRDGGVWVARGRGLQRLDANLQATQVADLTPLGNSGSVQVLCEDSEGALWLGTKGNGLYRFANGAFSRVPTSHDFILSLCEDTEGNLWVGTWGGGLNRIRPKAIRVVDTEDGLPKSLVLSLAEDTQGSMWIAARNAPPVSLPPTRDTVVVHSGIPVSPFASTLCPDRSGGVWLASERGGFCHWLNGTSTEARLQERFIISLFQDSQTNLWIGTLRGGLFRWQNGRAVAVDGGDDMQEVTVITEDDSGTLWVGTQKGTLHRRRRNETAFRRFGICDGPPGKKLQTIYAQDADTLWIGTRGAGIFRFKNEQAVALTRAQGLPDEDIRQILADDSGRLWFGSGRGLFRVNRRDLEAVADRRQPAAESLEFGASYGLANHEFQEGFRNAMCRSRDGTLWFATTKGAVEVDPHSDTTRQEPPPVHIEALLVDGRSAPLQAGRSIEVPPASGRVELRYTAVSFTAPENVRFRHRLDPLDTEWIEAGRERSATYYRVPPGEYRFHVIARGSSGTWNRVGASVVFTVKPTLWQNAWFRSLLLGAMLLLVALGVRFVLLRRMQQRMRSLEQAHALENERRRIARDMHDELGASLTRLALMSEQTRRNPALDPQTTKKMDRISRTAKEVAHTLDQIVWTVNPRNDTLERLIGYLSQYTLDYLAPTDIRLTQDLPERCAGYKVNSHARHEMFLSYKEALNNAVKHSGARSISLSIAVEGHILLITLADDGAGFSVADSQGKGEGLLSLRQRLKGVGGDCRVQSQPGRGTTITLSLPLEAGDAE